jgi:hypothetical protein
MRVRQKLGVSIDKPYANRCECGHHHEALRNVILFIAAKLIRDLCNVNPFFILN